MMFKFLVFVACIAMPVLCADDTSHVLLEMKNRLNTCERKFQVMERSNRRVENIVSGNKAAMESMAEGITTQLNDAIRSTKERVEQHEGEFEEARARMVGMENLLKQVFKQADEQTVFLENIGKILTTKQNEPSHLLDLKHNQETMKNTMQSMNEKINNNLQSIDGKINSNYNIIMKINNEFIKNITYYVAEYELALKDYNNGDYQKALTRFNYVYESRRSLLGEDNVDTVNSLDWKANTLDKLKKYNEANTIFDVVIEKRKKVQGVDHKDTLTAMNNKASTLQYMGRYQDAIDLFDIVIEKRKKVLREEHADTLHSINYKAYILDKMGRYQDAIDLYDIVIVKRKKVLGEKHADTLLSINNRAQTLKNMG